MQLQLLHLMESSVVVKTFNDKGLSDRIISYRYLSRDEADGKSTPSKAVPPEPNCRVCVRGFEDPDLLHIRRDAPTVVREAVAIIVCVLVQLRDTSIGYCSQRT